MASVPKTIPKEPGAARCGDTYTKAITVRGTIPGTDFGGAWQQQLNPVMFANKGSVVESLVSPPEYDNDGDVEKAADSVEERLVGVLDKLELESHLINKDQRKTLEGLVDRGLRALRQARDVDLFQASLPGQVSKGDPKKVQQLLVDALKHLRCAEYWTWRLFLYGQAKQEYRPAITDITARPQVGQPVFPVGPDALPGGTTTEPAKQTKKKGVSPWLIVGGFGLAATFWYFTRKK